VQHVTEATEVPWCDQRPEVGVAVLLELRQRRRCQQQHRTVLTGALRVMLISSAGS